MMYYLQCILALHLLLLVNQTLDKYDGWLVGLFSVWYVADIMWDIP